MSVTHDGLHCILTLEARDLPHVLETREHHQVELYDLTADPTEQQDISSEQPRRTYEMEQALRGWMGTHGTNPQDYLGMRQKPIEIF